MASVELNVGDRIYFHGDAANNEGRGTVVKLIELSRFSGTQVAIVMDDDRRFTVSLVSFSPEYLGHGGTRFVTMREYMRFVNARLDALRQVAAGRTSFEESGV